VVSYVSNAAISVTWPSTAQKKNAATNVVENTEVRIVNQMNTNVPTVKSKTEHWKNGNELKSLSLLIVYYILRWKMFDFC